MLTEFAGNLSHPLEFGHVLEVVAKTIDGAARLVLSGINVRPLFRFLTNYLSNWDSYQYVTNRL